MVLLQKVISLPKPSRNKCISGLLNSLVGYTQPILHGVCGTGEIYQLSLVIFYRNCWGLSLKSLTRSRHLLRSVLKGRLK